MGPLIGRNLSETYAEIEEKEGHEAAEEWIQPIRGIAIAALVFMVVSCLINLFSEGLAEINEWMGW